MQKNFHTSLLALFLWISFVIILVSYSSSDLRNSSLSSLLIGLDSGMGPKKWTRTKRLLEDSYCQNRNNEREMQAIPISDSAEEQESHFTRSSRGTYSKTKWTRTKTLLEDSHCQNDNDEIEMQGIPVCDSSEEHEVHFSRSSRGIQLVMSEENQCLKHQQNSESYSTTKFNHTPKRFRTREQSSGAIANSSLSANRISNMENPGTSQVLQSSNNSEFVETDEIRGLHLFGQASYQRSRAGSTIRYEDSGDDIHTCNYCNACFWFGEANKQSSSSAPLIYTNCCKKGQIKLEPSKSTPEFLERLLDPNRSSESRLFRENIRIYNSMFSFTSMGATIDQKINTGSGPYVFKINGQVHHLMGSILPSDGESPKYAQLYIYQVQKMKF
ncbi:uncharacterized protein LOC133712380 isoform X2 [Rosa rugosa]|uniref:uncharacterized protein LOC133712380 isoform X2 n=1 Tax=Rosa rugosa TaxID=74645 RepID=UPI002B408DA1|nr:uncharacterized protein LOC133712380 isoform X2 [Rosa rugosa]